MAAPTITLNTNGELSTEDSQLDLFSVSRYQNIIPETDHLASNQ